MKTRFWSRAWLLLSLGLAFSLRLYHLDFQSIWWDEGHSIFVASHPVSDIPTLPAMDVHPPAYFALLHGWMALVGESEFGLRYLSVIFSLLTVALVWPFARALLRVSESANQRMANEVSRSLNPPSPALSQGGSTLYLLSSILLAAVSPLYVAYAQEVRSYAMITCLALASTFTLWQIIALPLNRPRPSQIILYIVLTAACLYTHYFTIFLLLFHNLAWLIWVIYLPSRKLGASGKVVRGRFLFWLTSQAGLLLLFAPQLRLALRQVTGYTNPNLAPPSLTEFIGRSWQTYTVGLAVPPALALWGSAVIAGVVLFIYLRQLTVNKEHLTIHNSYRKGISLGLFTIHNSQFPLAFLSAWFIIPLAAYFIVLQRQPSFEPRYLMLVTPALLLFLGTGMQGCRGTGEQGSKGARFPFRAQGAGRSTQHVSARSLPMGHFTFHVSARSLPTGRFTFYVLRFILLLIPLIVFSASLYSYYTDETFFKDDSAGVAAWLAAESRPADLVYFDVPHPFHYYVAQGRIAAPARYLFVDIHTAADILTREAAGRERLYWVTWRGSDTDPRGVIPFLAQKYGQKLGEQEFRGYRVESFSLPAAGTVFTLPVDPAPADATFGGVLQLDGAAIGGYPPEGGTVPAGRPAWATLHFRLLRPTPVNYRVSLRLRTPAGQVAAQVDKDLLNDRHFRTAAWPLADPALNGALNVYTLPLAPDAPPGPYQVEVVVYNAEPPYPSEGVTGAAASPDGAAAVIGQLTLLP